MVVYTDSLQVLIDDFFAGKLTAQEYVDLYHELYRNGKPIDKGSVYATIWLSNDEYYPVEDREEHDIDENELKAQIKLFLENGIKQGYKIFHEYGGNKVAQYYEKQGIPLTKAIYKQFDE